VSEQQDFAGLLSSTQMQTIVAAVKQAVAGKDDYYGALLDLVERITAVNTQLVTNQEEIKRILSDEVVPALACVETADADKIRVMCEGLAKLLHVKDEVTLPDLMKELYGLFHSEEYKFLELIRDLKESNVIRIIRNGVIFIVMLLALLGLVTGYKTISDMRRPVPIAQPGR
jgi:hypothetical protein